MTVSVRTALFLIGTLGLVGLAAAQPTTKAPTAAQAAHFESKVRPLLLAKCVACHNAKAPSGGVRLDQAVSPAVAAQVQAAIRYEGKVKMPPAGKLPAAELSALESWLKDGAPWPAQVTLAPPTKAPHWAFLTPKLPLEPPVDANGIDAFVLGPLEKAGIAPAPRADKRTLLRRVTFDLTGLPPTPAEMAAFLNDTRPDAFARVVDRLLVSPRFGERWARHWLDIARYADSNGLDENLAHGNAWHYRDWVIEAINRDLPYDQFVADQLAGDLMPTSDETERGRRLTATGFLSLGPKVLAEQDKPKLVMDIVDEQLDVVSKSVMGLTISCARCHDHKFDPISTQDYYALAGIFKSTKTMANLDFVSRWHERPLESPTLKAAQAEFERTIQPLRAAQTEAKKRLEGIVTGAGGAQTADATGFARGANLGKDQYGPKSINSNGSPSWAEWDLTLPRAGQWKLYVRYAAEESRPVTLTVAGKKLENRAGRTTGGWNEDSQRWELAGTLDLATGACTVRLERAGGPIPHFTRIALLPESATDLAQAEAAVTATTKALREAEAKRPEVSFVMAVEDAKPEDVRVHRRGSTLDLGDVVPRGFPAVLCGGNRQELADRTASGRLELARWMTRPDHPLTARVAVNRAWQHLFGEGIVTTPDNWGLRGEKPTNPALLDYLAFLFPREDGWSLKKLLRRIVLSETYQRQSLYRDPVAERKDPDNKLLWRQNRRRLEAEPLRDTLHFVAGTLQEATGGTLLSTKNGDYVTNDQSANQAQYDAPRRAIYLPVIRNAVYDFFSTFDFGDPSLVNAHRAATTVAPQALFLLNSPLVQQQAQRFAASLTGATADDRITQAYQRAYQRLPLPGERALARQFLARADALFAQQDPQRHTERAWTAWCQSLLASNELIFVD